LFALLRLFSKSLIVSVPVDIGQYIGRLFQAAKSKASGIPFCLYHDGEYKEDDADIEVCLPIRDAISGEGIDVKRLPDLKAVATTHEGPYETLGEAYKALTDYSNGHQLKLKSLCREQYTKGPGMLFQGNPNKYVTEVAIEIEE
jgi:effector-binding domain-containing protein